MLDANEMINMANYIREKTTRCRSDIANVFDRVVELDSIAKSLEDLAKRGMAGNPDGPVGGSPLAPTEINNIDIDDFPQEEATDDVEEEVVAVGSGEESEA
jgi:hypothetical protein|tara:strand:- start:507 stop:809 length:303 start_codon:yes stop_codon:yes gene_type:complete